MWPLRSAIHTPFVRQVLEARMVELCFNEHAAFLEKDHKY
jgi:hypothetical protein